MTVKRTRSESYDKLFQAAVDLPDDEYLAIGDVLMSILTSGPKPATRLFVETVVLELLEPVVEVRAEGRQRLRTAFDEIVGGLE